LLDAGSAGTSVVTFASATNFEVGDLVRVTLTVPSASSQSIVKSFSHVVEKGAISVTDVASAFAGYITAAIDAGLSTYVASASNVAGVLTVTQAGDDKVNLTSTAYTNSATATATAVDTATTYSEGQPSDLVDAGIPASKITLASYDTAKLVYTPKVAVPFIDSEGTIVKEIIWFGPDGTGNTALNALLPA
jgi:hypothetical protein